MADFDQFLANLMNTERDVLSTENHYLTIMFLNRIRDESRFNSFGPKKVKLRALDSIPKMQRDLMSAEDLEKCKAIGISQEIIDIEEEYKLAELKELVIKNNYPIFGSVYAPYIKELFWAFEGLGAWKSYNEQEEQKIKERRIQ